MVNRRDFIAGAATAAGAVTVMASEAGIAAQEPTMSLNVVYPNHEGAKFDLAYYRSTHIPMVIKVMKASRAILIEGVAMGNGAPPYAMIAHIQFPSADALKAGLADPGMAEVRADVARFTDIKPTVMIGRSQ
jgi:uncharacterized protein (TIGR02118 family)